MKKASLMIFFSFSSAIVKECIAKPRSVALQAVRAFDLQLHLRKCQSSLLASHGSVWTTCLEEVSL